MERDRVLVAGPRRFGRRWLLALLVACLAVAGVRSLPLHAAAGEQPQSDYSIVDIYNCDPTAPGGSCDRTVQGISPVLDLFFPGPGEYQLASAGSFFQLTFQHSAVLLSDLSTLTITLNGAQMPNSAGSADNAVRLDSSNKADATLTFQLPPALIHPGLNDVQLRFYQRFRTPCDDPSNPALLSTVRESTKIHYAYAPGFPMQTNRDKLDLKNFPAPFFQSGYTRAGSTYFVFPPNPTRGELTAAATIALGMGSAAGRGAQQLKLNSITTDKLTDDIKHGNDLIAIGTPQRNALAGQIARGTSISIGSDGTSFVQTSGKNSGSGTPLDPTAGVLALAASPFDGSRAALAVSGGDDDALLRAALAISDAQASSLLQGDSSAVIQPKDLRAFVEAPPVAAAYDRSFAGLGLSDVTVNGSGADIAASSNVHTVDVAFDAPAAPTTGDVTLQLVVSHADSSTLDYNRSTLKVVLNGLNVASTALDGSNTNRGEVDFKLRGADLKPGINNLQIVFTIMPHAAASNAQDASQCAPESDRGWATLWRDSNIHIPGGGASPQPPDLANYPYPFLNAGSMQSTYLVVSNDADTQQRGLELAADIGRRTKGTTQFLNMVRSDDLSPDIKQRANLIVIGRPSEQPGMFQEINGQLPLSFVADGSGAIVDKVAQTRPEVLIATRDRASLGIDEIVPSPYNPNHALAVVTGTTDAGLELGRLALSRPVLSSNIAVSADRYKTASLLTLTTSQTTAAAKAQTATTAQKDALPLLTGLFVVAALALGGYWAYVASRRSQEDA